MTTASAARDADAALQTILKAVVVGAQAQDPSSRPGREDDASAAFASAGALAPLIPDHTRDQAIVFDDGFIGKKRYTRVDAIQDRNITGDSLLTSVWGGLSHFHFLKARPESIGATIVLLQGAACRAKAGKWVSMRSNLVALEASDAVLRAGDREVEPWRSSFRDVVGWWPESASVPGGATQKCSAEVWQVDYFWVVGTPRVPESLAKLGVAGSWKRASAAKHPSHLEQLRQSFATRKCERKCAHLTNDPCHSQSRTRRLGERQPPSHGESRPTLAPTGRSESSE